MLATVFRALRDDIDPVKARRAIPGLVFVGIAIVLLAVQVGPQYRHSKDMAATILVLGLLLFGIYGAFAWGEPPERSESRSEGSNTD
jgi:ABC-type transport system involved in cytochrome c biogenesis permease component